jgi:hypothetical protein
MNSGRLSITTWSPRCTPRQRAVGQTFKAFAHIGVAPALAVVPPVFGIKRARPNLNIANRVNRALDKTAQSITAIVPQGIA